jgi:hypothetical protein
MYNIVLHIMQLGYAAVMCVELCTLLEPLLMNVTCCPPPLLPPCRGYTRKEPYATNIWTPMAENWNGR